MKKWLLILLLTLTGVSGFSQNRNAPLLAEDISKTAYRGNSYSIRIVYPQTLPDGHSMQTITAKAFNALPALRSNEMASTYQPVLNAFSGGVEILFSGAKTQLIGETGVWLEIKYGPNVVGAGVVRFSKAAMASATGQNTTIPLRVDDQVTFTLTIAESGGAAYVALAQQAVDDAQSILEQNQQLVADQDERIEAVESGVSTLTTALTTKASFYLITAANNTDAQTALTAAATGSVAKLLVANVAGTTTLYLYIPGVGLKDLIDLL